MIDHDFIEVVHASEHNLKNISIKIPRNKITVLTGLSGSGKSSLAFDTIFAEGQRRYIESLSSYARQFVEQMKKPKVERISGLSPAIAIHQKTISNNPRSTVGTVTEIYDYLRLLFAKVGVPKCPAHGQPVSGQSQEVILADIMSLPKQTKFYVMSPQARSKKGEFSKELRMWELGGYHKLRVDGEIKSIEEVGALKKTKPHDIDLIIDQMIMKDGMEYRLREAVEKSLEVGGGKVLVVQVDGTEKMYSTQSACPECGFSFPEIEPRLFSFNHPRGACPTCHGLGTQSEFLEFDDFSTEESTVDDEGQPLADASICSACAGLRLNTEALNVFVNEKNISEYSRLSIEELCTELKRLDIQSQQQKVVVKIVEQIVGRLEYLLKVGAGYLSIERRTRTLSGGEAQRIRLATQMGSALVGVLYVLDEPSIGLHPRDHDRLMKLIEELRDRGNTVLIVEHDEDTILRADHVIDIGPGAGKLGGQVLYQGDLAGLLECDLSRTGQYLKGAVTSPKPLEPRELKADQWLRVEGAEGNNLQSVQIEIPIGRLTSVTGVSGSGKSSMIIDTLYRYLAKHFYKSLAEPLKFAKVSGLEYIDKVIEIDQSPIGRTPRSTPATYIGLFPMIRDLYAALPESKVRGFLPGRFSFNVVGGRCETCAGQGEIRMEMHFMRDVFIKCEDCGGARYNRETLEIKYKNLSIAEALQLTVDEAYEVFQNVPQIKRKLATLKEVGLGYISLGQSSVTVSGGEAQRVKLAKELSRRGTGKTLYILDEPTTGLHFADVHKLIELLQELVKLGNTVLVIEHNLDVVLASDYVIDMGPEGGRGGGRVVGVGTPDEISQVVGSLTGEYIRKLKSARDQRDLH